MPTQQRPRPARPAPARVAVRPVTPDRWPDLERFCGPSGLYGNCWCMWWRRTAAEFDTGIRDKGRGNRTMLRRLTVNGSVPGLLAYDGDRTVGWVSVGPREQFGRVLRSPQLRPPPSAPPQAGAEHGDATWSVSCFYVPRVERGHGIGGVLLDAAVAHARSQGADVVEGYPVDAEAGQVDPSSLFTGTVRLFRSAGFRSVHHRGGRRHVVQKSTSTATRRP